MNINREPSGDVGNHATGAALASKRSTRDIPEPNESFSALVCHGGADTTAVVFAAKGCLSKTSESGYLMIFIGVIEWTCGNEATFFISDDEPLDFSLFPYVSLVFDCEPALFRSPYLHCA